MDILSNLAELSDERLAEYGTELRSAFDALIAIETPTPEQVTQAEQYADAIDATQTEAGSRATAAQALADRRAALASRFTATEPEPTEDDDAATDDDADDADADATDSGDATQAATMPPKKKKAAPGAPCADDDSTQASAADIARRTTRPPAPAPSRTPVVITAAADVPGFAVSQDLTMDQVGQALVARMRGFGKPTGDGRTENLHHYGVAQFRLDIPEDLVIDRHSDDMEVLTRARDEHRLPGNSLVAAGGWCAPSETLYDLCSVGETTEGILSVPEVGVRRGGIKYTSGPDFSAIYAGTGFFDLTEAQVIADTAKTCYEVPCPEFDEVRLDAVGLCIKAPILTNAAYPELVQRWLTGSMVAHQHKVNAKVIAALVAESGAAKVVTGLGSTAADTLGGLELLADGLRQKYRMGLNQSLEIVLPFWIKGALRADLANRTGQEAPVTDQQIQGHFAARNLAVQYVYGWQDLAGGALVYPATVNALMYPAGTFIKGTSDVISMNAVYDSASLTHNIYTALFFEEGVLVAKMCPESMLITLPVCNAGRTGKADLTCAAG